MNFGTRGGLLATAGLVALISAAPASAQTGTDQPDRETAPTEEARQTGGVAALSGDIVVTARKRGEERLQDVPIAATAFGPEQLAAQNFRDLQSLSFAMPNVQLDALGTSKGVANFSVRGLGINSSIPSIDPTVGVFVDGVYLGITSGVIADNFDLDGVEVLRGPQGVLFGRNVTGGAVLIRTAAPTDVLKASVYAGIESGPQYTGHASVSGPLIEDRLSAKLAAYISHDEGWFDKNEAGPARGKSDMLVVRGALRFTAGNFDATLRLEHGDSDGEPSPVQNHAIFPRNSYRFASTTPGFFAYDWDQAILEANLDVGLGDGKITSITGWRRFDNDVSTPADGTYRTPGVVNGVDFGNGASFDIDWITEQKQWSQELRYAGTFGRVDLTTGLYYFTQDVLYIEKRLVRTNLTTPTPQPAVGGGSGDFSSFGAFAAIDIHATDAFSVNLGLRYTSEEKDATISRMRAPGNVLDGMVGANYATRTLNPFAGDQPFNLKFHNWSPKVGFEWKPNDDAMIYGFWAIGYRSGGFNFRHSAFSLSPEPFGQERQTSFEIGGKFDLFDRRLRLNIAAFTNKINNIQREQQIPDLLSGTQQIVTNNGVARVQGFEGEARLKITDNLLLTGQFGYLDGKYLKVFGDLTGDGVVNAVDLALKLPRLSPWTYGASLVHDLDLAGAGVVTTRLSWNHRDLNYFNDNNRGFFPAVDMIDTNITFRPDGSQFSLSLYATNLLDETTYGANSTFPDIPGFGGDGTAGPVPTFSPLNRGRVIGAGVRYSF
jgi:iron complex outermembrane receptor protein